MSNDNSSHENSPESPGWYILFFQRRENPVVDQNCKRPRREITGNRIFSTVAELSGRDPSTAAGSSRREPGGLGSKEIEHGDRVQANADCIQARADLCQRLVDQLVDSDITKQEFIKKLKVAGITADQAQDFVQQAHQRIEIRLSKQRREKSLAPDLIRLSPTSDKDHGIQSQTLQLDVPDAKVDGDAWIKLENKAVAVDRHPSPPSFIDKLAELLDKDAGRRNQFGIPDFVIAGAPHLIHWESLPLQDPFIEKTNDLKRLYSSERALDSLLDFARGEAVLDPVSRGIWKLIILDQFVDFSKLYATFESTYDQNDNPKEFGFDFMLIKKDQVHQKRPVLDQSDWLQCYDAWAEGVVIFYPHCERELRTYRHEVIEIFQRGSHSIPIAIAFDIEIRSKYSNQPF
ncbi:hypothetical protein C0991_009026 [Blastosporella zonata]|nr:hypothetical protein C0991_009026 [Blastosporella zonata]